MLICRGDTSSLQSITTLREGFIFSHVTHLDHQGDRWPKVTL